MIFPSASAADSSISYIYQGQTIYVNDTIDISGAVSPYPELAYWDGFNMYNSAPAYTITLPNNRKGWYNFYVDPAIFATRLGSWYKYDEKIGYESHGNNLAFVVAKENITQVILNAPSSEIKGIVTPISIPSIPISQTTPKTTIITPTPTPTPAPVSWNFGKGDNAIIISLLIVGLFFGLFELFQSKFFGKNK